MSALDIGIITFVVGLIGGCYAYVRAVDHRSADKRQELQDCVEDSLKELTKSVGSLELAVTNRLTAIETALQIKKGSSEVTRSDGP